MCARRARFAKQLYLHSKYIIIIIVIILRTDAGQ